MSLRINAEMPARSSKYCSRCQDQLLFADPIFDATSRSDGSRICNACGLLEALRHDRQQRTREGLDS